MQGEQARFCRAHGVHDLAGPHGPSAEDAAHVIVAAHRDRDALRGGDIPPDGSQEPAHPGPGLPYRREQFGWHRGEFAQLFVPLAAVDPEEQRAARERGIRAPLPGHAERQVLCHAEPARGLLPGFGRILLVPLQLASRVDGPEVEPSSAEQLKRIHPISPPGRLGGGSSVEPRDGRDERPASAVDQEPRLGYSRDAYGLRRAEPLRYLPHRLEGHVFGGRRLVLGAAVRELASRSRTLEATEEATCLIVHARLRACRPNIYAQQHQATNFPFHLRHPERSHSPGAPTLRRLLMPVKCSVSPGDNREFYSHHPRRISWPDQRCESIVCESVRRALQL